MYTFDDNHFQTLHFWAPLPILCLAPNVKNRYISENAQGHPVRQGMSAAEQKDLPSLFETLLQQEQSGLLKARGLERYKELLIGSEGFQALPPDTYKAFKEQLPLLPHLPKPATLGAHAFLLSKKGGALIKDQYEDAHNAALLTYAAAAEVFLETSELISTGSLDRDSKLALAVRRLLLSAGNGPARALEFYRYTAKKTALKSEARPGQAKTQVLSAEEVKDINTTLDATRKLERLTRPKPIYTGPQRQGTYPWGTAAPARPRPYKQRDRRGRGRGRGRGRNRGRQ
jgi:hypothetical protein